MRLILFLLLSVNLHYDLSIANGVHDIFSNVDIENLLVTDGNIKDSITSFDCRTSDSNFIKLQEELVDCTIRIKSDDTDLKITFEDVSLFTCAKLKVGSWWNNTFN